MNVQGEGPAAPARGAFVWHDLMSTDTAGAAVFYAVLFGWTCRAGRFWRGSDAVAGIVALDPDLGWPAHWLGYAAVVDVEAALGKAMGYGATPLHPPTEAGEGSFAVLADPDGALLGLVSGTTAAAPYGPGAFVWDELFTEDDAIRGFYGRALGYAVGPSDTGAPGAGWVLRVDGIPLASILQRPDSNPPFWVPFVAGDPDDAVVKVEALGGRVVQAAAALPDGGRYCVLVDPTGAVFGVLR